MRRDVRPLELWRRQHPRDFGDQVGGNRVSVSHEACQRAVWMARLGRFGLVIHREDDSPWIRLDVVVVELLERFVGRKRPVW